MQILQDQLAEGAAALSAARADAQAAALAAESREQVLHLVSTCKRTISIEKPCHILPCLSDVSLRTHHG